MWPMPLKDMAIFSINWKGSQEIIQTYAILVIGNYYIIAGDCVISISLYLNLNRVMQR